MDGWPIMAQAAELAQRGEPFALATVVWRQGPSSGQQGSRAIITAAGEVRGWIGGACAEPSVIRQAREVIAEGAPRLLLLGTTEKFGDAIPDGMTVVPIACQSEGALEVYIEPVLPSPHLVVVGRSPMARTLAQMGTALGWRTDLRDWTEFSASDATSGSMVVVATQGHGDEEAVEQAVAAGPAYVGLVGSRQRGAAVLGYLADRGVAREGLDRVRVPAGLDLGKTSHPEIAVAILAELVQLRSAGQLSSPSAAPSAVDPGINPGKAGSIPGSTRDLGGTAGAAGTVAHSGAAEAVDPVCGMTAAAGKAGRPLEHGGATYYFCSAGCRAEFESDPDSYARKETRC
jgi:xanthine dehydrogenase accessory factor